MPAPPPGARSTPRAATQAGQPAPGPPPEETTGEQWGNYLVHESIELGGRITDRTGSVDMYNTLVNLHSGPRILEQTLSLQSTTHSGNLFDSLYASSFGWGGDPSNAARLRISKLGWYNFTGSFRRDKNYFNYDLFANPLNPLTITTPGIQPEPVNFSPHSYFTTRRLYDFALTLLPQKRLSFRIGYNRNRSEGPSYGTFHQGTEPLLDQSWNNTLNALQLGADFKVLPKTTLSFTETLQWAKIDTGYGLLPYNVFNLSNGVPASLGVPWDPANNNPCRAPLVGGVNANPTCNLYIGYTRNQRVRNFMPTEQLNLMSNSLRHVTLVGRLAYSSADMNTPLAEFYNGLDSRTAIRQFSSTGPAHGRWVSVNADFGVTIHLSNRFRVVDTFRFNNWREPGNFLETALYGYNAATAGAASAALPVATYPPTTLFHSSSSSPDMVVTNTGRFLKEDIKSNEIQLQADLSEHFGGRLGYRVRRRTVADQESSVAMNTYYPVFASAPCTAPCTVTVATAGDEAELDSFSFDEHTGIFGLWIRPVSKMRFNLNTEFTSAGDFITRISPRHQQQYRASFSYAPQSWVTFGASLNILERRNHSANVDFNGHVRNAGFSVMVAPNDRIGLDLAYNYSGFLQDANVCFTGTNTGVTGVACPDGAGLTLVLGNFEETNHFGSFALRVKPVKRVQAAIGYSITDTSGNILNLNALQPLGPLSSRYQQPLAMVGVEVVKRVTLNAGWNYYQYSESDVVGPTASRYFHSNITTLSLRYAF